MKNAMIQFSVLLLLFIVNHQGRADTDDALLKKIDANIEHAATEDWYVFAKNAEKLLKKDKFLDRAKELVERSINISERAYNTMLLADYYQRLNYPKKALELYVRALELLNGYDQVSNRDIQRKIAAIVFPEWNLKP